MDNRSQPAISVPVPPPGGHRWRRYVAIGDSLSEGLGDPLEGGATRGWAHQLARHLQREVPDLTFTNLAVRGHLARHALDTQLEPALRADPDLVSVFIGGNDVLLRRTFDTDRFRSELSALVGPFTGDATVVLSTLPDLTACGPLPPPARGRLRNRLQAANEVIRDTSERHGTVLLDAWADPRTRRHGMWSVDRIHPSAEGHRLIAASVAELLGVTTEDDDGHGLTGESLTAIARRYGREAAWLLRYARQRVP